MIRPFLLASTLFFATCASPGPGDCPVDMEILVPLMTELHLAEGLAKKAPSQFQDSMQEVYFVKVLEDHQLEKEDFDSLIWIVRQEPVWLDTLYTRIGVALARLEAERGGDAGGK